MNMRSLWTFIAALWLPVLLATPAVAAAAEDKVDLSAIVKQLSKSLPGLKQSDLRPIAGTDLVELLHNGEIAYVTRNGGYFIRGDLVRLTTRTNLAEERRSIMRRQALAAVHDQDAVIFAPKNPKFTVTVFTDMDCAYCRKMHSEIKSYNDEGIAVRYLAYPATGPGTESWTKAQAVWCSEDRRTALTRAKRDEPVPRKPGCDPAAVADEFDLAELFGIHGTPLIILPDGSRVDGYISAPKLLARLTGEATAKVSEMR
jgi:thiol:disulfide interchange protein DsbC